MRVQVSTRPLMTPTSNTYPETLSERAFFDLKWEGIPETALMHLWLWGITNSEPDSIRWKDIGCFYQTTHWFRKPHNAREFDLKVFIVAMHAAYCIRDDEMSVWTMSKGIPEWLQDAASWRPPGYSLARGTT